MKLPKKCLKCGRGPIQPPSKVLCAECFAKLDAKMMALGEVAARSPGEGQR